MKIQVHCGECGQRLWMTKREQVIDEEIIYRVQPCDSCLARAREQGDKVSPPVITKQPQGEIANIQAVLGLLTFDSGESGILKARELLHARLRQLSPVR